MENDEKQKEQLLYARLRVMLENGRMFDIDTSEVLIGRIQVVSKQNTSGDIKVISQDGDDSYFNVEFYTDNLTKENITLFTRVSRKLLDCTDYIIFSTLTKGEK